MGAGFRMLGPQIHFIRVQTGHFLHARDLSPQFGHFGVGGGHNGLRAKNPCVRSKPLIAGGVRFIELSFRVLTLVGVATGALLRSGAAL